MSGHDDDGNVLLKLRKSRKAFLLEYVCGIFLLGLLMVIYAKGVQLNLWAQYAVLGLGLASIATAELLRMMHSYILTPTKMIIVDGLIKKHHNKVSFFSLAFVPDIHLKQGLMQRLLGYGTVYLKNGSDNFSFQDVKDPHAILEKIEGLIESNKKHEGSNPKSPVKNRKI